MNYFFTGQLSPCSIHKVHGFCGKFCPWLLTTPVTELVFTARRFSTWHRGISCDWNCQKFRSTYVSFNSIDDSCFCSASDSRVTWFRSVQRRPFCCMTFHECFVLRNYSIGCLIRFARLAAKLFPLKSGSPCLMKSVAEIRCASCFLLLASCFFFWFSFVVFRRPALEPQSAPRSDGMSWLWARERALYEHSVLSWLWAQCSFLFLHVSCFCLLLVTLIQIWVGLNGR